MKRLGKMAAGLACGLALNAGIGAPNPAAVHHPPLSRAAMVPAPVPVSPEISTADNAVPENPLPGDPYSVIAARNVFGLLPPTLPANESSKEDPSKNLPKIVPQGIVGYFGNFQVLFKVLPAKPDPKAKDEYYSLSEGEMQDEIEVKKIDNADSLVTFINHGIAQELPLANAPSPGAAPTGPTPPNGMPAPAFPGFRGAQPANPGGVINFGGGGRNGLGVSTSGAAPDGANSSFPVSFGGAAPTGYVPPQQQDNLPADARVILMEGQRAQWQNAKNPALNPALIPPTPLTSLNTPGGEGDSGPGGVPAPPPPPVPR